MSHPIDFKAFLESTPVVPWEYRVAAGRLVYVGPQAHGLIGHPLDEWTQPDFWSAHVLPDDQASVVSARAALLDGGGSHVIEYRMEHARGHLVWVSEAATAVRSAGSIIGIRGLLSDVTERKRLETSLALSEARIRTLIRAAPDALIFTEIDGTILNFNDQAGYLLDYALEEVRGSSIDLLVPPRLRPRLVQQRAAFALGSHRQTLVDGHGFQIQRRTGEEIPVEVGVSAIQIGGARQLLYSFRDITARRRAEEQLRNSERRLRRMAEAVPALIGFVGEDRRYRFVNEAYAEWVGWRPADLEGRHVREVLGESVYQKLLPAIDAALSGVAVRFTGGPGVVGAEWREQAVDVSYVPHRESGRVTGYFVVVLEVQPGAVPRYPGLGHRRR